MKVIVSAVLALLSALSFAMMVVTLVSTSEFTVPLSSIKEITPSKDTILFDSGLRVGGIEKMVITGDEVEVTKRNFSVGTTFLFVIIGAAFAAGAIAIWLP